MTPDKIIELVLSGNPVSMLAGFAGVIYLCLDRKWLVLGSAYRAVVKASEEAKATARAEVEAERQRVERLTAEIRDRDDRDRSEMRAENERLREQVESLRTVSRSGECTP